MQEISNLIQKKVLELFDQQVEAELSRTDEQFGDFTTNVAMRLSKKLGQNPHEIAEMIAAELQNESIETSEVAGPGFINITLSSAALSNLALSTPRKTLQGQVIVAEYSDPNPFKVLHAGHLYTTLVGDSIARLLENAGATVHRVNFGGDVGRHVAITMWQIMKDLRTTPSDATVEHLETVKQILQKETLLWISKQYVLGTEAYDTDETAKKEITDINKLIYAIHAKTDTTTPLAQIYWLCRDECYKAFDEFYEQLGVTKFEKYYPESSVSELGLQTVKEHTGSVYKESDGAVIFEGEKHGLFTQVFINSEGLPTYAAKDVGLIYHKHRDFNQDQSFIITDVSQKDHLSVVMKSIEQFEPELVSKTTHLTHGRIKLAGGVKMSSRKGNFVTAEEILESARVANKYGDEQISLAAVKYSFTKQRIGGDIIYDPAESVSLHGNSGPYLQYAHARAASILLKAEANIKVDRSFDFAQDDTSWELNSSERSLLRKIGEYAEVVEYATKELMPHHINTYLYELAQIFNRFYEQNKVIGSDQQASRLMLVELYKNTLAKGLTLLGIHAPDTM